MRFWRRVIAWSVLAGVLAAAAARAGGADDKGGKPPVTVAGLALPEGLPRYELTVRIDPEQRRVTAKERVAFTNRTSQPVSELIFHVYPRYKVPDADRLILRRTLEMLRLSPEEAMDEQGRRLSVSEVRVRGRKVEHTFDPALDTILVVPLTEPLEPGQTTEAEVDFGLELPEQWGRWGSYRGITFLLNWYPVLAFHAEGGWERTPFVPWHQPWHQEAAFYTVNVDLPEKQVVASTGRIVHREQSAPGRQMITIATNAPARDFALVCSERFRVWEKQVGQTLVRVSAFAEHKENAKSVLEFASEVIPLYEQWFGPYPEAEFEVAASFFGWNGNECSGLVLLDERIFRLPAAGKRYLDHLVTHETCHQWWWNAVGTDGYAETFMDEGLVNGFTAMRLDDKYGRNAPLIVWPGLLNWLPTIGREDLRLAGYYGWRAHGNNGPVIQDLKQMGNLYALFSLAYDRGGMVISMLRNRMGTERFFGFWQGVYRRYAFRTFHYQDLKHELDAFDPAGNWPAYLDAWLVEHRDTDWSVERVQIQADAEGQGKTVTIALKQAGQMVEPTLVSCRAGQDELRVPIWPDRGSYDVPGAHVERTQDQWVVTVQAPVAPSQVEVDPGHALLDANPANNRWKPEVSWRLTPIMSPLDESSQFQAYDRPSIVAGPFIDQYARGGFKVGAQRVGQWQLIGWAGTEPALREAIFGGQFTLFNMPWPKWSAGMFYEEGLYNFYNDKRHSGGRAFLRYRILESSSFLIDDQGFAELYYGLGNEFWAGDDGRPVNAYLGAVGGRYHMSTLFPYWDPVGGYLFDATAEYGNALIGSAFNYVRWTLQYGIVRPAPQIFGLFSHTRLAVRAYGGMGWPNTEPLFRLGGGQRLRALDLTSFEGSAVWLVTVEARFPIWRALDRDVLDHVVAFRNLFGTVFYDVGQSFLGGQPSPVVNGVGVGFRIDTSLFSFLERANLRVDMAQPIGLNRGPVLWFGINQVF